MLGLYNGVVAGVLRPRFDARWRRVIHVLYGPRNKSRSRVHLVDDYYRDGYALYMPRIGAYWLSDKYRVTAMEAGAIFNSLSENVSDGDDSYADVFEN